MKTLNIINKGHIGVALGALVSALCVISCAKGASDFPTEGALNLKVSCSEITKATAAGEDSYNENLISKVDYFLYPQGQNTSAAVYSGSATVNQTGTANISINISGSALDALFPGAATACDIFLVANHTGSYPQDTSIDGIRAQTLSTPFDTEDAAKGKQPNFIMTGQSTVTLDRTAPMSATSRISLSRLAAKVVLQVSVADKITISGTQWTPQYETMTATMRNANNTTTLGASKFVPNYISYGSHGSVKTTATEGGSTITIGAFAPFYTYPQKWSQGQLDAHGSSWQWDENAPYVLLTIRFQNVSTGAWKPFYYRVYLAGYSFEPNTWNEERVNISILGSEYETEPLEVSIEDCALNVADWTSAPMQDVHVYDTRTLYMLDNNIILDNVESTEINYISSHPIEVVSVTMTRKNYQQETPTDTTIAFNGSYEVDPASRTKIKFYHGLNNNLSSKDYDVSSYSFDIAVRHKDMPSMTGTVHIEQRPAVYIVNDRNSDTEDTNNGYVKVNNGNMVYVANGARVNLGTNGNDMEHSSNKNPNRYKIKTYVLPEGSPNILGDPRQIEIDNLKTENDRSDWIASAAAIEGGNRQMRYYYPTGKTLDYSNIISPEFMIASSHGTTAADITYRDALRRCATYQEDGYPAGRWRVPTAAELAYIAKLSTDGRIPYIYGESDKEIEYWVSSGWVTVPKFGESVTNLISHPYFTVNDGKCVRCVYDTWYWTDKVNKGTFTWGDKRR